MPTQIILKDKQLIKKYKNILNVYNIKPKIIIKTNSLIILEITIDESTSANKDLFVTLENSNKDDKIEIVHDNSPSKIPNTTIITGHRQKIKLAEFINLYFHDNEHLTELIKNHVSTKYTLYPPLILFNYSPVKQMFTSELWESVLSNCHSNGVNRDSFFKKLIKNCFDDSIYTHIAINQPILENDSKTNINDNKNLWRKPLNIRPIYGSFWETEEYASNNSPELWKSPTERDFTNAFWCHTVQNGIYQSWAPFFTMFSRGNVKEKARILITTKTAEGNNSYADIEGNDVVDMYCGIGYFTLSYLKRNCNRIFCFDLNPWSCEGLKRALLKNKFEKDDKKRCYIFNESNEYCLSELENYEKQFVNNIDTSRLRIRHINMGLLPTSEASWELALKIVAKHSYELPIVTLHIHENIHIDEIEGENGFVKCKLLPKLKNYQVTIENNFKVNVTHAEKIKTYAPDIWHVCIDVDIIK
ncbi:related to tRNA wybutosine-synthesizing protein 2 [Saccharomycodes ludwigii]|uniref:tRNA wybutosine-synthesizing protein 2 n=1 Tax=Saccharomycodes ludwigii TaxID=36035 RepID=A0A376B4B1_9ASCO|nr:hypothetical protein SCDLUD_002737 [Saccharomycodes ludwigii]KAH3901248.1 hypothetical protein SCDLUD_002737 [Saccharomycodes ludwigii]SSD59536.1 related to tRNA wybutosine-synthesizing protein 2 [Saccharomycodes ludwigii]